MGVSSGGEMTEVVVATIDQGLLEGFEVEGLDVFVSDGAAQKRFEFGWLRANPGEIGPCVRLSKEV